MCDFLCCRSVYSTRPIHRTYLSFSTSRRPDMSRTVVSADRNCYIELLNFYTDPNVWIVRKSRKFFLFKKQLKAYRFIDPEQARRFADGLKKECGKAGG